MAPRKLLSLKNVGKRVYEKSNIEKEEQKLSNRNMLIKNKKNKEE